MIETQSRFIVESLWQTLDSGHRFLLRMPLVSFLSGANLSACSKQGEASQFSCFAPSLKTYTDGT